VGRACRPAVDPAGAPLLAAAGKADGEGALLVAPMLQGTRELIAGLARDPKFGRTVVVGLGGILARQRRGTRLRRDTCIARHWPGFAITYRHGSSLYAISVANPNGVERKVASVALDGATLAGEWVELLDDGRRHEVTVTLG